MEDVGLKEPNDMHKDHICGSWEPNWTSRYTQGSHLWVCEGIYETYTRPLWVLKDRAREGTDLNWFFTQALAGFLNQYKSTKLN